VPPSSWLRAPVQPCWCCRAGVHQAALGVSASRRRPSAARRMTDVWATAPARRLGLATMTPPATRSGRKHGVGETESRREIVRITANGSRQRTLGAAVTLPPSSLVTSLSAGPAILAQCLGPGRKSADSLKKFWAVTRAVALVALAQYPPLTVHAHLNEAVLMIK
jgi:hypothetical protein